MGLGFMPWIIFFTEFLILFLTSRFLFKSFYALLYFVFHSQRVAIVILSAFFLPGVFIHEMAHLVVAELLRVKTHGVEFMPELTGNSLKMGSVKVERSDIIRSLLIGIAPLVVGSAILVLSLFVLRNTFSYPQIVSSVPSFATAFLVGLSVFIIANTMFSSKKDVEGLLEVVIVMSLVVGGLYVAGVSPHEWVREILMQPQALRYTEKIDWLLAVPAGINVVVVSFSLPLLKKLHLV